MRLRIRTGYLTPEVALWETSGRGRWITPEWRANGKERNHFRIADNPGVGPSNDREGETYDRSDDCAVFHAGRNLHLEGQRRLNAERYDIRLS